MCQLQSTTWFLTRYLVGSHPKRSLLPLLFVVLLSKADADFE